jgi:hypothetical protein
MISCSVKGKLLDISLYTNEVLSNIMILQQMITDYNKFAKEVGVVVPKGAKAALQYANIYPPDYPIRLVIPLFHKPTGENLKNALQISF